MTKVCTGCGLAKSLEEFHPAKGRRDGRTSRCKSCCNAQTKERLKLGCYSKRKQNTKYARERLLAKQYGITLTEEARLFQLASNKCQVCGSNVDLKIDHDHKTGAVRGVLCSKCNSALGYLGDNITNVLKLVQYLQNAPTTVNILGLLNSMATRGGI